MPGAESWIQESPTGRMGTAWPDLQILTVAEAAEQNTRALLFKLKTIFKIRTWHYLHVHTRVSPYEHLRMAFICTHMLQTYRVAALFTYL